MRHGLYKVDLENDVTVYEPNKGDGRIRAYVKYTRLKSCASGC